MKTMLLLTMLLALSGSALAGVDAHAFLGLPDGSTHTADAFVGDDGSTVVLVDGAPLAVPSAPETPELPALPVLP